MHTRPDSGSQETRPGPRNELVGRRTPKTVFRYSPAANSDSIVSTNSDANGVRRPRPMPLYMQRPCGTQSPPKRPTKGGTLISARHAAPSVRGDVDSASNPTQRIRCVAASNRRMNQKHALPGLVSNGVRRVLLCAFALPLDSGRNLYLRLPVASAFSRIATTAALLARRAPRRLRRRPIHRSQRPRNAHRVVQAKSLLNRRALLTSLRATLSSAIARRGPVRARDLPLTFFQNGQRT